MKQFVKEKVSNLLFWMYCVWVLGVISGVPLMFIMTPAPVVWKWIIGLSMVANLVFLKEIERFFEKNMRL